MSELTDWQKQHGADAVPKRQVCQGAVLVIGMNDGIGLLAYCGGGGAWSDFLSDELDLQTDPPELLRKHMAQCPGRRQT